MSQVWRGGLLALSLALGIEPPSTAVAADRAVDAAVMLALDESASISTSVFAFQQRGHAAALRDPAVVRAFTQGPNRAVALMAAGFSGPGSLRVLVPWTVVAGAEDAARFADALLLAPPATAPGATALGNAIEQALPWFAAGGFQAGRRVIDLVSNGFNNAGPDPSHGRQRAARAGVTVNALVILDEYNWLEAYYRDTVIEGAGGFVLAVAAANDIAAALARKLVIEVSALPAR